MAWEEAITYCEDLSLGGETDWRLPNIKELDSIVDHTKAHPAIDSVIFLNPDSSDFWSSSTYTPSDANAWTVDFDHDYSIPNNKTSTLLVRCVRDGE